MTAVIGDMVKSTALTARARAKAQLDFDRLIALLNQRFRRSIAARFVITTGDEFQGLLHDASIIPDIVWLIESEYHNRDVRLGFGHGRLHTPLKTVALNIDGPVFHHARAAIDQAGRRRLLGGVFEGFGAYDPVLTGYAQILRHTRERMTLKQRQVLDVLRAGETQLGAAEKLRISKQAVSNHAIKAGWEPYRLAETGWKTVLTFATGGKR